MAFFRLCDDDPVVTELRDIFKANIVRIPEERIAPLTVLLSSKDSARFIGHIGTLLDGPHFTTPLEDVKQSDMATLTNRRSRMVEGEVGTQILSGLLAGLGGSFAPDISVHMKNAKALQFSFPAVRRLYVEIGRIGELLAGRAFDKTNLLTPTLLEPKTTIRLIDSVITSRSFDIEAGDAGGGDLKVNVPALQEALASAKIEVTSKNAGQLTFQSNKRLTFAFTCVNVTATADRRIRAIAPSKDKIAPPQLAGSDPDAGLEAHVLLSRAPTMIDLDEATV
jgi:hypothetical protein